MKAKHHHDSILIDMLGGTSRVAEIFNISPPSVSEWRKSGIPEARMMYLEVKYKSVIKKFREEKND